MSDEIYLIRHGLTESNKKRIYAGWNGEGLCLEGMQAVSDISVRMKEFQIEKIFSSPLRRAIQTAEIIDSHLKRGVAIENLLKEMRLGPWEGLSESQVAKRFPGEWKIWNTMPSKLEIKGRETLKDILLRALMCVNRISGLSHERRILAVTHVALIRILMIYYNGLDLDDYRKIEIPNSSVYSISTGMTENRMRRVL